MLQWLEQRLQDPASLRYHPWVEMQLAMVHLAEETAAGSNEPDSLLSTDLEGVLATARDMTYGSVFGMQHAVM
jgi:hypothetical protein